MVALSLADHSVTTAGDAFRPVPDSVVLQVVIASPRARDTRNTPQIFAEHPHILPEYDVRHQEPVAADQAKSITLHRAFSRLRISAAELEHAHCSAVVSIGAHGGGMLKRPRLRLSVWGEDALSIAGKGFSLSLIAHTLDHTGGYALRPLSKPLDANSVLFMQAITPNYNKRIGKPKQHSLVL